MVSEETASTNTAQTGVDTQRASAPPLASTDTSRTDMASSDDNVSAVKGPVATATPASQCVGGRLCEHSLGTEKNDTVAAPKTTEEDSEHTSELLGLNTAQPSTRTKMETEQKLGEPNISQDIASDLANDSRENTAALINGTSFPRAKRHVADSSDLAVLEAGARAAQGVLNAIRVLMADTKEREQFGWLEAIDKLKTSSEMTRTVVAIVGATGAGKSSLVNAVLDEELLVPVSSYKACTSVVTEISYNDLDDDPRTAYRAEVEFISQEDWASELDLLHGDLVDGNEASLEAEIALSKIRAVYPDLTHDMIVKSDPEQLAKRGWVLAVLGSTRRFSCSNARDLHSAIQVYLESKDKKPNGVARKPQDLAFWPLIKVVRVYCKADVLSTGVVLADIPGSQGDANAARSAVASRYMAECSAVWVTAPLKRAVDDKTAKDLLGRWSRLQLKLDGIYSSVTVICTMADAIQLSEDLETFDEDGHIQAILDKEDDLDTSIQETKETIDNLEQQRNVTISACDSIGIELTVWKKLERKKSKGQQVYAPRIPAKRKRPAAAATRTYHRQLVVVDESDDDDTTERMPLTTDEIQSKLVEIEGTAQSKDEEWAAMEKRLEDLKATLVRLQEKKNGLEHEGLRLCIRNRNEHVREVIRKDFATGIMEIDEEGAQADEETDDPSVRRRDYDEVARSLAVFCTSSKAYQQLRGRKKRDARTEGFKHLHDTEMPFLQKHAKDLPKKNRIVSLQHCLNEFCRLMSSLTLWVGSSAPEYKATGMSEQDKSSEIQHLHVVVENLKKHLSILILDTKERLCSVQHVIYNTTTISHASNSMEGIVSKWSTTEANGGYGLAYNTYQAICRRGGSKTQSNKSRDFNEDILEPFLLRTATGWEQFFSQSIPTSLDELVVTLTDTLTDCCSTISSSPKIQESCERNSLDIIWQQVDSHRSSISNMVRVVKATIHAEQRLANRSFLPEVKKRMAQAYSQCAAEKGPGCYMRMKDHMRRHTSKNKNAIYRKASKRVMKNLDNIFESLRRKMEEIVHLLVDIMEGDFRTVILSSKMLEVSEVPRDPIRDHIRDVLYEIDLQFVEILSMDVQLLQGTPQSDASESMFIES